MGSEYLHPPTAGQNRLTQSLRYNEGLNTSHNLLTRGKTEWLSGSRTVVSVQVVYPCDRMADGELRLTTTASILREYQTPYRWPRKASKFKVRSLLNVYCFHITISWDHPYCDTDWGKEGFPALSAEEWKEILNSRWWQKTRPWNRQQARKWGGRKAR